MTGHATIRHATIRQATIGHATIGHATRSVALDGLVVCAPTRAEARAVRRGGIAGESVVLTGAGSRSARRASQAVELGAAGSLVVAGIGGGLNRALAPGDLVVATEIRGATQTIECAAAELVAAALRRHGLTAHAGPILSCDHVVARESERAALAATGAIAVDMESAWLLQRHQATQPLVIRAVADVAGEPMLRPSTLGKVRRALAALSTAMPVVASWAAARGERQVLLAGPRSFCAGVVRAVDAVERALEVEHEPVYVRKEIVHNKHVVGRLRDRGAVFVDELHEVPTGSPVIFSAHGVSPAVREDARRRGLRVIDATCPLVGKVHAEVRRYADQGETILFIGHAGHEEAVGTLGERPDQTVLVEDVRAAATIRVPDPHRVRYLVQTTLSADEVDEVVGVLRERFPDLRGPSSDDICYATTNRQRAVTRVAEQADVCLVVGSVNSSNSRRLVEVAQRAGTEAHLIEDASQIDLDWLSGRGRVALTAGASAPMQLVDETVSALRSLGPVQVEHHDLTHENVHFTLPKELRTP